MIHYLIPMRFVTFQNPQGAAEPGVSIGDRIIGLKEAGFASIIDVLTGGEQALAKARDWATSPAASCVHTAAQCKLMAPVPRPPKLICVGLNYRDHAAESNMAIPEVPTIFSKFSSCVIGPGDPIVLPKNSVKPDYE